MTNKKQVLLITSPREEGWIDSGSTQVSRGLREFINDLNSRNEDLEFYVTTLDKIDVTIDAGMITMFDRFTNRDIAQYDMIHFRNVTLFHDFARAIALYMASHNKKTFEVIDTQLAEYGKLSQMVLFTLNDIAVPRTWVSWRVQDLHNLLRSHNIGYPIILKANNGIKGHDNYLVQSEEGMLQIIADNPDMQFVAQTFIPNDGDYRVLCFSDAAEPLVFKRVAAPGSHLNNTSRGGRSEEISVNEFDKQALQLSYEAARATHRALAGVDVIQDNKTGEWLILEVNTAPALSSGTLLHRKADGYIRMIKELI